jgi:glucokinase
MDRVAHKIRAELNLKAVEFVNDRSRRVRYAPPDARDTTFCHAAASNLARRYSIVGPARGSALPACSYCDTHFVLATEAGQAAFAPAASGSRCVSCAAVPVMFRRKQRVGPDSSTAFGPWRTRWRGDAFDSLAAITRAARCRRRAARRTLDTFCGLLGGSATSFCSMAPAGAYLAGGSCRK